MQDMPYEERLISLNGQHLNKEDYFRRLLSAIRQ